MDTSVPPPEFNGNIGQYPSQEGFMSKVYGFFTTIREFIIDNKWAIVFVIVAAIIAYQLGRVYSFIGDIKNKDPFRQLMKGEGDAGGLLDAIKKDNDNEKRDVKGSSTKGSSAKGDNKEEKPTPKKDVKEHFEDASVADSDDNESVQSNDGSEVETFRARCDREAGLYRAKPVLSSPIAETRPPVRSTLASASCPNMEDYLPKSFVEKNYIHKKDVPKCELARKPTAPRRRVCRPSAMSVEEPVSVEERPCPVRRKVKAPAHPPACNCVKCIEIVIPATKKSREGKYRSLQKKLSQQPTAECVNVEMKRQFMDATQASYDKNRDMMGDGSYSFLSREPCNMQTCIPNGKNMGLLPTDLPSNKKRK